MEDRMELEHTGEGKKHIPWDKLMGAALIGAVGSALLYYIFLQFPEEKREEYRQKAIEFARNNMTKLFIHQEETEV